MYTRDEYVCRHRVHTVTCMYVCMMYTPCAHRDVYVCTHTLCTRCVHPKTTRVKIRDICIQSLIHV
jgi:hypothetical protein